jgi:hypothetical protein
MFSKECDLDLQTIGLHLEETQGELQSRIAQTMRQEAEIRQKRAELETLNIKLEAKIRKNKK